MNRKLLVGAAAVALAGLGALAMPAEAAPGDTAATFTITGGSLGISVPSGTVAIQTVNAASLAASGALGNVTVTDNRAALVATWTATVSSTDFTTGTATANEKVTKASIAYAAGLASASSGVGTFVPGTLASLSAAGTAASWTVGVGVNSATWSPTITFTLAASQVAGTYSGTITHSVA